MPERVARRERDMVREREGDRVRERVARRFGRRRRIQPTVLLVVAVIRDALRRAPLCAGDDDEGMPESQIVRGVCVPGVSERRFGVGFGLRPNVPRRPRVRPQSVTASSSRAGRPHGRLQTPIANNRSHFTSLSSRFSLSESGRHMVADVSTAPVAETAMKAWTVVGLCRNRTRVSESWMVD